ncbi:MAG: hypothetical protein EB015_22360 [Methylocystaceae bacterium]|nr:hypothetical protein [Methylocystaceae bacterium]
MKNPINEAYEAVEPDSDASVKRKIVVPGEVIDSSELDHTVTYQLRVAHEDNAIYVDGRDPKPQIPEAI